MFAYLVTFQLSGSIQLIQELSKFKLQLPTDITVVPKLPGVATCICILSFMKSYNIIVYAMCICIRKLSLSNEKGSLEIWKFQ